MISCFAFVLLEHCDCLLELVMMYGNGGSNLENAKMLHTYVHYYIHCSTVWSLNRLVLRARHRHLI
jgi:hypothetical protein